MLEDEVPARVATQALATEGRRAGRLPALSPWLDETPGLGKAMAQWAVELLPVRAAIPERVEKLLHPASGAARAARLAKVAAILAREGMHIGGIDAPMAAIHRQSVGPAAAHRMRRAFERLGPSYLKLGQFISSGRGLFPDVLVDEFGACRDRCPKLSAKTIRAAVERELGHPIADVFSSFDNEPLAAASIAQVHSATLVDGRVVVVKVQRPGIAQEVAAHTSTMPALARLVERLFPNAPVADLHAVVRLFATTILQELDFRLEAQNMVDVALDLEAAGVRDVVVPHPVPELVTERMLVMERFDGLRFDELAEMQAAGIDTTALLLSGLRALVEGATVFGRFHGDIHAGNVIALPDGRFGLVDFGICARLDADERAGLQRLLTGIASGDSLAQVQGLDALGALPDAVDRRRLVGLLILASQDERSSLSVDDLRDGAPRIMRIFTEHKLLLPPALVLFFKDVLYLNGSTRLLAPDLDLLSLFGGLRAHFDTKYGADRANDPPSSATANDYGGPLNDQELAKLSEEIAAAKAEGDPLAATPAEPPTLASSLKRFGPELIRSALVPMVLFVVLEGRLGLAAAIVGLTAWTLGLSMIQRARGKNSPLAWITLFFALTRGALGLLSGSGVLYFLPDVLNNFVYGGALLVTVAVRRPAIGLAARAFYPFPPVVRRLPQFRRVFKRLTLAWAGWLIGSGLLQLWLLLTVESATFAIARRVVSIPGMIVLFIVSLRYPRKVFQNDLEIVSLLGRGAPA
ncbi:MAG TPA: VC0807 family protein [Acidimicrobiales bacterium]|nr:VC0807 family protein [Acidimicrobiales bacterium]